MEIQLPLTNPNTNSSKAHKLLARLNQLKERTRDEFSGRIKRLEKSRQQARYRVGQAVLDDAEVLQRVMLLLPDNVKLHVDNYAADGEEIARLRSEMPR